MSDTTMDLPRPVDVPPRRRRFSLVWLMPLLALAIAAYVVWSNYASRGPLIDITFKSAAGMRAGATEVRIRDLRVGVVEEVGFADGMSAVQAKVRLDKSVAQYIDADASFWLVQPKVTARGITGIDTLLSGVYIAASWDGEQGEAATEFTALPVPPLIGFGEEGTRIVLRARAGGQLAAGAPVLASGIEVGRIGQPVLSTSGTVVTMEAFILAPYDQRLTTNGRFWDASGLRVNLGAEGLALKVDSLAALLEGGVTFGTPVTGGEPISPGHIYDVFASEATARADAFEEVNSPDVLASIILDGDVNGLGVDTPVRFKGVKVGEIDDVVGIAPPEGSEEGVKLRVDIRLQPTRLGLPARLSLDRIRAALAVRVAAGLRARVGTEGLFGQSAIIELINDRSAPTAEMVIGDNGRLLLPTVPAREKAPGEGVDGLVARVSNLPIEELMVAATQALNGVTGLTGSAQDVLTADGMDRIPQNIEATLADVRALVAGIREGGAVDNLNAALKSADSVLKTADSALKSADTALASFRDVPPAVTVALNQVSTLLEDVRAGGAVDNLNATLQNAQSALQSADVALKGAEQLPQTLNGTLLEVQALMVGIREGGAIDSLNATLQSAEAALKSADIALKSAEDIPASVQTTLDDVRALVTGIREGGAVDNLNAALRSADSALKSADVALKSVEGVPATLDETLREVNALVVRLREGGAVDNLNATLQSADSALKSVDGAVQTLPALAQRLNVAADGLSSVVSGYSSQSRFYKDVRAALRDISNTADAFRSLARSIERNPSSLLRGR